MSELDNQVPSSCVAKVSRVEGILGYDFTDKGVLCAALTHPSALDGMENQYDYERLEFLGDSILGALTAEHLFSEFDDLDEGGLTRLKASLVSGASLARIAAEQGLGECIIFGESEVGTDGRGLNSALENVYEAIVAALYLDGGMSAAQAWVARSLLVHADKSLAAVPENPKSSLQELLQERGKHPEYLIVDVDGPPHDRTFRAQALIDGEVAGEGCGHSKKLAEAEAAKAALAKLA